MSRTRLAAAWILGSAALVALFVADIVQGSSGLSASVVWDAILRPRPIPSHDLVRELRLPRAAAGIVCGAALGSAAVLLQSVTRNRLADPSTLGLAAGGTLTVTLASAYASLAPGASTIAIAFVGVLAAGLIIGVLGAGSQSGPLRLVLAGMAVGLALSAITSAIHLIRENETSGLFLWGGGTLLQVGWSQVQAGAIIGTLAVLGALTLGRGLDIVGLGDPAARALGLRPGGIRTVALALAAVLTAVAVGVAGPLAFVGLGAAHIARFARPKRTSTLLGLAMLAGAVAVLGADVLARIVLGAVDETPVGVVCALVGAPALILVARAGIPGAGAETMSLATTARRRRWLLWVPPAFAIGVGLAALCFGELSVGPRAILGSLTGLGHDPLADLVVDLRGPRLAVALVAGACLAASGTTLQATVRNPLASPELIGVTGGASVAAFAVLLIWPGSPAGALPFAAFAGGMLALGIVLGLAGRNTAPARVVLIGIAVTAASAGITTLMVLHAAPAAASAVVWLVGSTYGSDLTDLVIVGVPALLLIPAVFLLTPHMDALALGDDAAANLGIPLGRTRALLLVLGGALACAAVAAVGAVAFVGLVAPHAARMIAGASHRRLLLSAMGLGAGLLAAADVIGRLAFDPIEVPSGIVVSLLGAPYLAWLMWRTRPAQ